MSRKELKQEKAWYMSAVESCLILHGMTRKEAVALIKKYHLKEHLHRYPELQMHYDVEVTADEILSIA